MTHPGVVRKGESEVLPAHGFGVAKDAINNAQGCLQVRVPFVVLGSHDRMPARDGLEYGLVGFSTNALALDGKVEERFGAEVGLVPEFRDNNWTSRRSVEAFEHRVVKSFQWGGSNAGVPNDLRDEPHDSHDYVRVHRHLEHPGDAVRIQHVAVPISFLIEERRWLFGWVGHGQLDVIVQTTPVERAKPA